MTNKAQRHDVAREAAATLAAQLLVQRCRHGAEGALMPQSRHLSIAADALVGWLQDGGFTEEAAQGTPETKTAAQGRRSRVQTEDISEEW